MRTADGIPEFPWLAASLMEALPLTPLVFVTQRLAGNLGRRHPSLFTRLGSHAGKVFLIDPVDLPIAFRLVPALRCPRVEVLRGNARCRWDARIAGRLAAFMGLIHGTFDGDALFFSRDLVIEGDTEAVLALRNAIDNAEIDLATEVAAMLGPFAATATGAMRHLLPVAERLTGVALTRAKGGVG